MKLKNLTKVYSSGIIGRSRTVAVDRVSFEVEEGEIVALVGESGSGKTTIGKLVLRLIKPTSGTIEFMGKDVREYSPKEYYRMVQGVFQDPFASFNPVYKVDRVFENVFDNLLEVTDHGERYEMIEDSLKSVGLNPRDILGKYPHQLSGGQLQRVLIARSLIIGVKFLVADEIISMLDASTRVDVLNILGDLKRERGRSILFITHDLSLGYYISDTTLIMYRGQIVEMGDTEKVFSNPLHPYTKMLLESVPTLDKKWEPAREIFKVGDEISYSSKGCRYYDRCPFRKRGCEEYEYSLVEFEENHKVACFLYGR